MSSRKVFPGDTQWAIAGKIAVADDLTRRRKLRSFTVFFDPRDSDCSCVVSEPSKRNAWFTTGEPNPSHVQLDSILGETTMDGVLRVLEIPRELFSAAPEPATPTPA